MFRAILLAIIYAAPFIGSTSTVSAGWDEAVAAYRRGDYATAVREMRPPAEQGSSFSQIFLGEMYSKGLGVPQDHAEAVRWYRMAAEKGEPEAQSQLGIKYALGQGVPQDYTEAVKWFRKAAEQGNVQAQYNLGVSYDTGQGVPQDYMWAHMWYSLAASKFPPGKDRDTAVENRDGIAKQMTPAQIAEAQKLAREWKPKR